jgi:hypothetical protein
MLKRLIVLAAATAAIVTICHSEHDSRPPASPAQVRGPIRSESLRRMAVAPHGLHETWRLSTAFLKTLLWPSLAAIGATDLNFDGLGDGFSGPGGTFSVAVAPPDPAGDVGPDHFVQAVNSALAVFDKTGLPLLGPVPLNTLWSGFGGDCELNNDGQPTVLYDQIAGRWIISQMSVSGADGAARPFLACVAVSTSGDPAGAYFRYAFPYATLPVASALAMWPDAYYMTFDTVAGAGAPASAKVCAYDRTTMLTGQPATQQCFNSGAGTRGVLPADLDGATLPPAGNPAYLLSLGSDQASLELRTILVDWTAPANSGLSVPRVLAVSPWTEPASLSVPQPGGGMLDPVNNRLMRRLVYRAFPDGRSALVANHTVVAGTSTGIRWYEVGVSTRIPVVTQEGTWAPDSSHRFVGGIAMDRVGNVGLGFSTSSASIHPELRYTGRLASDPLGAMTQGEGLVIASGGSQDRALSRWGDYSSMTVDPVDDCTFWFIGEYLPASGAFNWRTRVATFVSPGCDAPPASDFLMAVSPDNAAVAAGSSTSYTISTRPLDGSTPSITLSVAGLPAGASATFSPAVISAGESSTMIVRTPVNAVSSMSTLTITGTSGTTSREAVATLTVTPPPFDFILSISPSVATLAASSSVSLTVSSALVSGDEQPVTLSVSGLPNGVVGRFSPPAVIAGGSSTLTLSAGAIVAAGTTTISVTGAAGPAVRMATGSLTVVSSGTPLPLVNEVPITELSGATGSSRYFVLTVPAGQALLTFTMSGGTGDADMYVRFGSLPTQSNYACRPYLNGNTETCTFANPQPGDWFVMVRAYNAYSGVSLKGTYAADTTELLSNGVPVTGVAGAAGSQRFWKLQVPAGQAKVVFTMSGGTGDADLYVRFGAKPTITSYACRPYLNGNNEICTINNPQPGDWFVMVRGYIAFSGMTLTGTYTAPSPDTTPLLTNGVPVPGIAGANGSLQYWKLPVPAGQAKVVFTIAGGTGDADLYVRFGAKPTITNYVCRPYLNGNNETCTINNPQPGDWFVMIRGYTAFSGATLTGRFP